jgi:hypothetical protein
MDAEKDAAWILEQDEEENTTKEEGYTWDGEAKEGEEDALQLDGSGSSRNTKRARTSTVLDNHQEVKFLCVEGVLISILMSTCALYLCKILLNDLMRERDI